MLPLRLDLEIRYTQPTINLGEADVLVSFEKLESSKIVPQLKKDGTLIVNEEEMWPITSISKDMESILKG